MHRLALAAAAAILAAGLPCGPAQATGDVLVPSDDAAAPSSPSQDTQADLPVLDSSSQEAAPPARDYSPVPADAIARKSAEDQAPPAPQIFQVPAVAAQSTPEDAGLPNTLKIDVVRNSHWGISDTSTIGNSLGLSSDSVSKHCRLSAGGMATSTIAGGIYSFDTGVASDTLLRYDGKLTGITVHLQALCDPVPLPGSARYIVKVGDNYSIFLAQLTCDTPPENAQRLIVHYAGNDSGKCVFE